MRLNLVVEIGVPETLATILSELKILEYLELLLKKKRLIANKMANTNAIFDFPRVLNIFVISCIASIIIVSISESKLCLK